MSKLCEDTSVLLVLSFGRDPPSCPADADLQLDPSGLQPGARAVASRQTPWDHNCAAMHQSDDRMPCGSHQPGVRESIG